MDGVRRAGRLRGTLRGRGLIALPAAALCALLPRNAVDGAENLEAAVQDSFTAWEVRRNCHSHDVQLTARRGRRGHQGLGHGRAGHARGRQAAAHYPAAARIWRSGCQGRDSTQRHPCGELYGPRMRSLCATCEAGVAGQSSASKPCARSIGQGAAVCK